MFPFDYIPKTIDPTIRKILISLISIQFIAFLILMIVLMYEYCTKKPNKEVSEKDDNNAKKDDNKKEKPKEIKNNKKKKNKLKINNASIK